ncbi:MAG: hypothetical protein KF760_19475 [Candidatus Eremiobacteraeota bacterium]|nr:hypothetical protein [Candidatus Eremiobacteraeota bacterium]MCW5868751.1 hypothetical protein [Candidatus Eremiobacteraeota bacterium]
MIGSIFLGLFSLSFLTVALPHLVLGGSESARRSVRMTCRGLAVLGLLTFVIACTTLEEDLRVLYTGVAMSLVAVAYGSIGLNHLASPKPLCAG